jgi:3-deoxy-D-manno-octulosonic-acid transferase
LSELSFIGGSFVPVGGHNPLEAILVNSAVVSGNQFSNWQGIYQDLEACGGACIVGSKEALQQSLSRLLKDENARQQQIKAASRLLNASRGALESHFLTIKELVNKSH